jgi:hypothetical protein
MRFRLLFILIVAFASVSAVAQKATADFDPSGNFSAYKTYVWGEGTPARDPLVAQRIVAGIEAQMAAKGFTKASSLEGADVIIAYQTARDVETQLNTYSTGGWGGWGGGWGYWGGGMGSTTTTVSKIPVGELIVDMADLKSHKFVWRGRATGTIKDKPENNAKLIDKALTKMFAKYPPQPKK